MGYISIMKGKHVFPVPWKTGVHYSQKRLHEFKEIKQEMKLPSTLNVKKAETKAVEENKLVTPPTIAPPQPPSTSVKDMLPVLKYKNPERERLRTEQEAKREKGRVKEIIFLKANNLKKIKYPHKHKQHRQQQRGFNIPIIHPRNNFIKFSMEGEKKSGMSEVVAEVPKEIIKKPGIKDRLREFVYSEHYTSTAKAVIAGISMISLLVTFLAGSFLFFAFFAPYYMVGYETTITVPINKTVNETVIPVPINNQPVVIPSKPDTNVIVVNLPPSQIIPVTIPPSVVPPNPTTTPPPPTPSQTSKVNTYGISFFGIPSSLEYLTNYQCYWDLRNKGFGKEFNPEYECNAQGTGLWNEACKCCHLINPKAC